MSKTVFVAQVNTFNVSPSEGDYIAVFTTLKAAIDDITGIGWDEDTFTSTISYDEFGCLCVKMKLDAEVVGTITETSIYGEDK